MAIIIKCPYCNKLNAIDKSLIFKPAIHCQNIECLHVIAKEGREVKRKIKEDQK